MPDWGVFATIVGGAAAALLGLLFVAVSIRIQVIAGSTELRLRAAQTLSLFTAMLLVAVLLAVPGQPARVLGIEVIVLAVLTAVTLLVLDRRATAPSPTPLGRAIQRINPNVVTSVTLLAAGILMVVIGEVGIYVLVPAVFVAFVGGVLSAWVFLIHVDA